MLDVIEPAAKGCQLEMRVTIDETRKDRSFAMLIDLGTRELRDQIIAASDGNDLCTIKRDSATGDRLG